MEKYFFDDGRTCWGPVKAARIVELYEDGILSSQSRIRICGHLQWQTLGDIESLYQACREAKAQRTAAELKNFPLRRLLAAIFPSGQKEATKKTKK